MLAFWQARAGMPTARSSLLVREVNGILYAIGGLNDSTRLRTNEAYDPGTDSWATKADMPTARNALCGGTIDGILYVTGGWNGSTSLSVTEAYDPITNSWTTKAALPTARWGSGSFVVNGLLHVAGGQSTTVHEAYDPVTDTWATKASKPSELRYPATGVWNGLAYLVGGAYSSTCSTVNEAYDPAFDTWTSKADMPTAREKAGGGFLNGTLYVAGGYNGSSYLDVVEAYDSRTDSWITQTSMLAARGSVGSDVLQSDALYVIGGRDASAPALNTNEVLIASKGLLFRDPTDGSYFTDDKGNVLKQLDFGNLRAGETSFVKAVVLENSYDFAVTGVQVSKLEDIPAPDRLEISKTNNPFVAEDVLSFGGPYNSGDDIATFYVRVVSDEDSAGLKPFKLRARADIAS